MEIREIMTENPVCCVSETNLEEVARMMAENDCGAIPVVEDQERWKPMGIGSQGDIALHRGGQETVKVIGEVSRPSSPDR